MSGLTLILIFTAAVVAVGFFTVFSWLVYTAYLNRVERRLALRKGIYRDLVAGLAARQRTLLDEELRQLKTLKDFAALEAVLEEQARGVAERPAWLLDAYDRLGLIDKYIDRLRHAKRWRERAFAAELLGRVGNAKAVPAILETVQATRTEDGDVREIALRALARIADPRAVGPLVDALRHAEVWLAPRIADILSRHGELVIEPMIAFLNEPGHHTARAWAANVLGEVGATRAFPSLVRALNDADDEVRAKAASALGAIGDRRAITYLLDHLLSDPAPFVRARIASALGRFNDPEVIHRLVRALGDPAWWVRMRSVEALEHIGQDAEGPLLLALDDPDPEIRIRAAVALERMGLPARLIGMVDAGESSPHLVETLVKFGAAGAREFLAEHLAHPSVEVRGTILDTIRRAGRRELAVELVEAARHDPAPENRATAFETLRALGLEDGVEAALDGLADPDERVRAAAMGLIGHLGAPELSGRIAPLVDDPQPLVRAAAALALGLIRSHRLAPRLVELLADGSAEVRAAAARGIAMAEHRAALPALVPRLDDPDPVVRLEAARALGQLDEPAAVAGLVEHFDASDPEMAAAVAGSVARLDVGAIPGLLAGIPAGEGREAKLAVVKTVAHARGQDALAVLTGLWHDVDPVVRGAATEALGRFAEPTAAIHLERALEDPNPVVRAHAADGIARQARPEHGPAILRALRDPAPEVRERAALAAGLLRIAEGEPALLALCAPQEPPNVRAAALLALAAYEQESIVARVVEMADEQTIRDLLSHRLKHDPEFRLLAQRLREARHLEIRVLGAATREQMEASLVEGMRSILDPADRRRMVDAFRAFQGERSRDALLQAVRSDPSPEIRAAALAAVAGMLSQNELLLAIRRALTDPDPRVRLEAVGLAEHLPPDRVLDTLLEMLREEEDDQAILRTVAARAEAAFDAFAAMATSAQPERVTVALRLLRHISHSGVGGLVERLADAPAPAVRRAVADLLHDRTDLWNEELAVALAADPVPEVRVAAARAFAAAQRTEALLALAVDPDPSVRRQVAFGMTAVPRRREQVLARLLGDPDESVRAAAWVAALLRGERRTLPARVSREAAAAAVREGTDLTALRRTLDTEPNDRSRLAAGIALALLGDASARAAAAGDPSERVRAGIRAALPLGEEAH